MSARDRSNDTVLLDEPFLLMTYSATEKLVHLQWKGHARSDEHRRGLETGLDFVAWNDVRYWLADLRDMGAILKADEQWGNEVWFPKLFNTSLEKMAILPSRDYFNQTSVQRSLTAVNGQLTFKVGWFESVEEAMDWLKHKEAISA